MKRQLTSLAILLTVVSALTCGAYQWSEDDCDRRGGHIEFVYGGRGGWVCDGAER